MLTYIFLILFILIGAGLAWYLIRNDDGEKEPVAALWTAAGFGLGGAVIASFIEQTFLNSKNLKLGAHVGPLFLTSLAVGVIEEACKFLPLAVYIYKKHYFNEHTDGIIYFALAGLGFGVPENILYTIQFGTSAGIGRVILTPFFHAALTGLVGFYLAKLKLAGKNPLDIVPVLVLAMVVHGIYDYGLLSGNNLMTLLSVLITLSLSIGLFVAYAFAKEDDEDLGLSVVGVNNYCRHCGQANPHHHLYCTVCGSHA